MSGSKLYCACNLIGKTELRRRRLAGLDARVRVRKRRKRIYAKFGRNM